MDAGADVAYARRISRAGESRFKRTTAGLFYRLLRWLSQTDVPIDTGDFRLMSGQVADILRQMPEPHRFLRGMVAWVGFRQVAVNYHRDSRFAGKTKYGIGSMVSLAIDAVTGFASAPLRFMFYLSAAASVAAAFFLPGQFMRSCFFPSFPDGRASCAFNSRFRQLICSPSDLSGNMLAAPLFRVKAGRCL